jgi:hypothetical protein
MNQALLQLSSLPLRRRPVIAGMGALKLHRCGFVSQSTASLNAAAATSKQKKRLLDQNQVPVEGTAQAGETLSSTGGNLSSSVPPPPPPPSSGGGGSIVPAVLIGTLAIGSAFYYFNVYNISDPIPADKAVATVKETPAGVETATVGSSASSDIPPMNISVPSTSPVKAGEKAVDGAVKPSIADTVETPVQGHRVSVIPMPASMRKKSNVVAAAAVEDQPATPEHPEGGHRVSNLLHKIHLPHLPKSHDIADTHMTEKSLEELKGSKLSHALPSPHVHHYTPKSEHERKEASGDAEDPVVAQLRDKITQLTKELEERTRWEAIRLQEFMTIKEKETADR